MAATSKPSKGAGKIPKPSTKNAHSPRTRVTIICSRARRGEALLDWTLGFEGELSAEERRLRIGALVRKFARVRVFVAKKLVEQFPAIEVAHRRKAPITPLRRLAEESLPAAQSLDAAIQTSVSAGSGRASAIPRLVKRVPLRTEEQPARPLVTVEGRHSTRSAGPYQEEPES
jgi:hypothetical protein